MRWRGLLLALVVLHTPLPSHASDPQKPASKPAQEIPDLAPADLEAWNHFSIRAKKLNHSGIALVIIASVLVVPGIIGVALDLAPTDPGYDQQTSGFGSLLIATPSFCAAAVGYAVGFGLLGTGWTEAAKARKLATGELTARKLRWSPPTPGMRPEDVKDLTLAGLVIQGWSLAVLAGAWVSWGISAGKGFRESAGTFVWGALLATGHALFAAGTPMLLASNEGIREAAGLKSRSGIQVAGWVFYALALASLPGYWAFRIPYIGFASSGCLIIGALLSMTAGVRSLKLVKAYSEEQSASSVTLMPFISPVPGGMIAGVGGAF